MTPKLRPEQSVTAVRGIGTQRAERLAQLDITTVQDLLNHVPVRYKDKREIRTSGEFVEGADTLAQGVLTSLRSRRTGSGRSLIEVRMRDPDGFFYISFFNSPYLERQLVKGAEYTVYGKVQFRNGLRLFTNPEIVPAGGDRDLRRIEPVYRCTAGVTTREFIKWITYALDNTEVTDWLSDTVRRERKLCELGTAYRNIHFPKDRHWYQVARYRMIYDQLLTYQIALRRSRLLRDDASTDASIPDADITPFLRSLPFELTSGQVDAVRDIEADLVSRRPMNRLVQGDVGSGKTVVAEAAIYKTVQAGRQAAFMAPTEILARQHFQKLSADFEPLGIRVALLVSGMRAQERRQILEETANGIIQVLIGTHALLQSL